MPLTLEGELPRVGRNLYADCLTRSTDDGVFVCVMSQSQAILAVFGLFNVSLVLSVLPLCIKWATWH